MNNFLGAAFGFGARDVGLGAAFDSANNSLESINDSLDKQDKKGSKLGKMWAKLNKRTEQFNIASIASNVRSLTGDTGNLSNSLESMAVSYTQAVSPMVAAMDLTGKEAKKLTGRMVSMAISMNTGVEGVGETLKGIDQASDAAKKSLDAMGMSEKEWVKVTQTTGVTMDTYTALMTDMVNSWGASPKQAGKMIDNIMAIGKVSKIGINAIAGAKGHFDSLNATFETLPPNLARSADEIQSLMESTYKLSGAFKEMGETEADATKAGEATAKMFAEQSVEIDKIMGHGGSGNLSDSKLFTFLSQLGIGTEEAVRIIQVGSRDALAGVTEINKVFEKMGPDQSGNVSHALAGLSEAMGSSAAGLGWLAGNVTKGTEALDKMTNATIDGEGALKKYGNQAFKTGRTLQESFDLAKESFDTQIRSIARSDVKKLVGSQMGAYKEVGKEIKELGSDETWGGLINSLSRFKQMGATGLFLSLGEAMGLDAKGASKMGIKFGLAFDTLKDLGSELAPVKELMGMFGIGGVAAGGIAGFFMLDASEQNKIMDSIKPLWEKVVKAWDTKVVPGIKRAWPRIAEGAKAIWTYITTEIPWAQIGDDYIWPALSTLGEKVWEALKWAWGKVGEEMGTGGQLAVGGVLLGAVGGSGLLGAAGSFVGVIANGFSKSGSIYVAMLAAGAAVGTMISNEWEEFTDKQQDKFEQIRSGTTNVRNVAKSGTSDEKVKALFEAERNLKEAWTSGTSTTDIGDFFTKDIWGEENTRDQTIKAATEQFAIMKVAVERERKDLERVTSGLQSGDVDIMQAAKFEAEDIMGYTANATAAGTEIMGEFGKALGSKESVEAVDNGVKEPLDKLKHNLGGSLPEEGPLAGGPGNNPMYHGGLDIMYEFANGIFDSAGMVSDTISQVLEDSVIASLDTYAEKVKEWSSKKSLLQSIAHQMVKDFGGKGMDMGTIQMEGQADLNSKKTFEAALSIPGMAGVIAAIIADGHQTRVVLKKIQENTSSIANSQLVSSTSVNNGRLAVLPS